MNFVKIDLKKLKEAINHQTKLIDLNKTNYVGILSMQNNLMKRMLAVSADVV